MCEEDNRKLPQLYSVFNTVTMRKHAGTAITQTSTPKGADLSWGIDSPCSAESTEESAEETDASKYKHVEKLQTVNKLLPLDGHKPINRTLQVSWVDASERTK